MAAEGSTNAAPQRGIVLGQWGFGFATTAVILAVSFILWYLFVDPTTFLKIYPQPFGCWLFWNILTLVWPEFNFESYHFQSITTQPAKGIALFIASFVVAVVIILAINVGLGYLDPSFAWDRPSGLGYVTNAMWVLLGFYFYGANVAQWGGAVQRPQAAHQGCCATCASAPLWLLSATCSWFTPTSRPGHRKGR